MLLFLSLEYLLTQSCIFQNYLSVGLLSSTQTPDTHKHSYVYTVEGPFLQWNRGKAKGDG